MNVKNATVVSRTGDPRTKMARYAGGVGALLLFGALSACSVGGLGLGPTSSPTGSPSNAPSGDRGVTTSKFQEGDCIGYSLGTKETRKVTCGSPNSTDKVVKAFPRELSDDERNDSDLCPGDSSLEVTSTTYCLLLDVKAGDCLTPGDETDASYKISCTGAGKKERVTKVIADSEGDCGKDVSSHKSENPPQTVCITEVNA